MPHSFINARRTYDAKWRNTLSGRRRVVESRALRLVTDRWDRTGATDALFDT